jgi:hypothetical protein
MTITVAWLAALLGLLAVQTHRSPATHTTNDGTIATSIAAGNHQTTPHKPEDPPPR